VLKNRIALVAAVCFMSLSLFMIPVQADSIYAYITADPVVTENGQSSTLTVSGYLYGTGTFAVNVEFWDSDKFEDITSDDDHVGSCDTTVTVKGVGSFTCKFDVVASEFMAGNIDEEADWVEFYAIVTTKSVESYNTGTVLVYCSWCSGEELGPAPSK
jgi:hypothetical protein